MANFEVLSLDPTTPQIRAPGAGDGYSVPRDMTFAVGTTLNAPTTVVSVNTATDALRITQVGSGNALVVEDSANPDATPTVITAAGDVGIGTTPAASQTFIAGANTQKIVAATDGATNALMQLKGYRAAVSGSGLLVLAKSRGATIGTETATTSGDSLGAVSFEGVNSSNTVAGSSYILGAQDGAAGATYVPGRMQFYTSDGTNIPAERMRITSSGNVGIATTTPGVNFEIGGNNNLVRALAVRYSSVPVYLSNSFDGTSGLSTLSNNSYNTSSGSSSWSAFQNASYGCSAVQLASNVGSSDIRFFTAAAANTNPSERARIDSSGNVGLGVTPSAWGDSANNSKAIQFSSGSVSSYRTERINIGLNYFFDGTNFKYTNNGTASYYQQFAGSHLWFTAASGTAGNTFTPTQVMTLDASGNLGVGTTSPARTFAVFSAGSIPIRIESSGTDAQVEILTSSGSSGRCWVQASSGALTFGASNAERARITSAGELLVGTTTVAGGARITSSGDIAFSGAGTGARLRNRITAISVSTSATTIIDAGDLGQLVVVNGNDGTNRFCDLVMTATNAAPTVIQSYTALGTPAARTYTRSGTNLQLALASGTYNVYALSLGF